MKKILIILSFFVTYSAYAQYVINRPIANRIVYSDPTLIVGATRINPIPFTGFTKVGNNITKTSDGGVEWNQRMLGDGVYAVQWNPLMADCGLYLNGTNSSSSSPNFAGLYVVSGTLYYEQNGGIEGSASTQPTTGAYIALRRVSGTLYLSYTYDLGSTWINAYTYGTIANTYLISSHFGSRTLYDPQGVGITTL